MCHVQYMYFIVELPCLKKMKNGGVVPKEQLSVKRVEGPKSTIITLKSQVEPKDTPQWESMKITKGDVKLVKVTPTDKSGKPTDQPQTANVQDPTKASEIRFKKPLVGEQLSVELVPKGDKPTDADIISVVGCVPVDGKIYTYTCSFVKYVKISLLFMSLS